MILGTGVSINCMRYLLFAINSAAAQIYLREESKLPPNLPISEINKKEDSVWVTI
jgi:hypothetical protein